MATDMYRGEYSNRENKMNDFIIENVKLTKDAVLVNRYFGQELQSRLFQLTWKYKINELIIEANRLEELSKKDK